MVRRRCTIALLAHVSAGIYAGRWKERLRDHFPTIVTELLSEQFETEDGRNAPLGRYFERVILTKLYP